MSENGNMDTSPDSEADTASGGPAEPREDASGDTAEAGSPADPAATEQDGTPVDNPSG